MANISVEKRKFDNQCQSMKPLMELLILLKQWIPLILLKQHQHLSQHIYQLTHHHFYHLAQHPLRDRRMRWKQRSRWNE